MREIRKDIQFFLKENNIIHMYDPLTKEHYKIGLKQKEWLEAIDGTRDDSELRKIISNEYFDDFMMYIEKYNLLEDAKKKIKPLRINPFKIKINIIKNDEFFERIKKFCIYYRIILFVVTPILLVLTILLAMFIKIDITINFANIISNVRINNILLYLLIIFFTGTAHELSHTFVAKSYSVSVPSIGIMLFYFMPSFFVDISGINFINKKSDRIKILLSGVLMNFNISVVCLISILIFNIESEYIIFTMILNFMMIIINLIPYIEFDGYYIFINMLENPTIKYSLLLKKKLLPHEIIFSIISFLFVSSIIFSTVSNVISYFQYSDIYTYILSIVVISMYGLLTKKGVSK